jgi:hypothetical protein
MPFSRLTSGVRDCSIQSHGTIVLRFSSKRLFLCLPFSFVPLRRLREGVWYDRHMLEKLEDDSLLEFDGPSLRRCFLTFRLEMSLCLGFKVYEVISMHF